jgi:hypothetical protein
MSPEQFEARGPIYQATQSNTPINRLRKPVGGFHNPRSNKTMKPTELIPEVDLSTISKLPIETVRHIWTLFFCLCESEIPDSTIVRIRDGEKIYDLDSDLCHRVFQIYVFVCELIPYIEPAELMQMLEELNAVLEPIASQHGVETLKELLESQHTSSPSRRMPF